MLPWSIASLPGRSYKDLRTLSRYIFRWVEVMSNAQELVENAIDANATSIEVVVSDGGMKVLQITDNGTGIDVCA